MMRNLNKSIQDSRNFLQHVINSKKGTNKARMQTLQGDLNTRFEEYNDKATTSCLHELEQKWNYNKDKKSEEGFFLYNQYDNSKSSISNLRAELIHSNGGEINLYCPICGFRETTDLDHYIPRQLFPEFSVHPYNLIPTCHECNNSKGVLWCECDERGTKRRLIFNAYYDTPTNEELFDVNIVIEKKIPRINLLLKSFSEPMNADTRIAVSTINQLNLMPALNVEINKRLKTQMVRIKAEKNQWKRDEEELENFMINTYKEMASDIDDVNNLDKILYSLLADNKLLKRRML